MDQHSHALIVIGFEGQLVIQPLLGKSTSEFIGEF